MSMQVAHVVNVLVCYPNNGVLVCLETAPKGISAVALHEESDFQTISVVSFRYAI